MDNNLHVTFVTKEQDYTCYGTNKKLFGVAYPLNDTVLVLSDNHCSAFDPKTGALKKHFSFTGIIEDFDTKNEELVVVTKEDDFLYNIKTDSRRGIGEINGQSKRIIFLPDNRLAAFFEWLDNGRFIEGITFVNEEANLYRYTLMFDAYCDTTFFCAARPKTKEVFFLNTNKNSNKPQHIICEGSSDGYAKRATVKNDKASLLCAYNPDGTVLAVQTISDGYEFYNVKGYEYTSYLTINSLNKKPCDITSFCYSAIAFHPYKSFVALMNYYNNSIEFHSYAKKSDDTLLARIAVDASESWFSLCTSNKYMAFSRDGKSLVAMKNKYDSKFYIIPTPLCAYFNKNIVSKCVFINFILNACVFIPWDIKKLIFNNIAYSADF